MSVDKSTVVRIAQLARIRISEDDLGALAEELSKIVGWVEQLDEVDTEGVTPMASTTEGTSLRQRDDVVSDGDCRDEVLSNAPETKKKIRYLRVRRGFPAWTVPSEIWRIILWPKSVYGCTETCGGLR